MYIHVKEKKKQNKKKENVSFIEARCFSQEDRVPRGQRGAFVAAERYLPATDAASSTGGRVSATRVAAGEIRQGGHVLISLRYRRISVVGS